MMKKQFFTLILNATILTTNPLWAMDLAEPDKEHKCPSCHPELLFLQPNEAESKGTLSVIPNDVLIKTLSTLSLQDMNTVPLVSKAMYNLCQNPLIWENLCDENPEGGCPKEEFKFYRNLFKNKKQEYILTFPQVQRIVKEGIFEEALLSPWSTANHKRYESTIKNNKFDVVPIMIREHVNEQFKTVITYNCNKKDIEEVEPFIAKRAKVAFRWDPDYKNVHSYKKVGFSSTIHAFEGSQNLLTHKVLNDTETTALLAEPRKAATEIKKVIFYIGRVDPTEE